MKTKRYLARFLETGDSNGLSESETASDALLYEKIRLYSAQLDTPLRPEISRPELQAARPPKVVRFRLQSAFLAAASVVVLLGLGWWFTFGQTREFRTGYGQFQNLALPDGSSVTLNIDGALNYKPFNWEQNRVVNLEGEAWFRVAKGQKFSVKTPTGTVSVMGTKFNVRSRGAKLRVDCFEGRVLVIRNGKKRVISAGESVSVSGNDWAGFVPLGEEPVWMHRQMHFESAQLEEILSELQRNYNIRIDSRVSSQKTFTGMLPSDDLETALSIVEKAYALKRREPGSGKYELISR